MMLNVVVLSLVCCEAEYFLLLSFDYFNSRADSKSIAERIIGESNWNMKSCKLTRSKLTRKEKNLCFLLHL